MHSPSAELPLRTLVLTALNKTINCMPQIVEARLISMNLLDASNARSPAGDGTDGCWPFFYHLHIKADYPRQLEPGVVYRLRLCLTNELDGFISSDIAAFCPLPLEVSAVVERGGMHMAGAEVPFRLVTNPKARPELPRSGQTVVEFALLPATSRTLAHRLPSNSASSATSAVQFRISVALTSPQTVPNFGFVAACTDILQFTPAASRIHGSGRTNLLSAPSMPSLSVESVFAGHGMIRALGLKEKGKHKRGEKDPEAKRRTHAESTTTTTPNSSGVFHSFDVPSHMAVVRHVASVAGIEMKVGVDSNGPSGSNNAAHTLFVAAPPTKRGISCRGNKEKESALAMVWASENACRPQPPVVVQELCGCEIGARLWDCSMYLVQYLADVLYNRLPSPLCAPAATLSSSQSQSLFVGKRVIELGSGVGLVGIWLWRVMLACELVAEELRTDFTRCQHDFPYALASFSSSSSSSSFLPPSASSSSLSSSSSCSCLISPSIISPVLPSQPSLPAPPAASFSQSLSSPVTTFSSSPCSPSSLSVLVPSSTSACVSSSSLASPCVSSASVASLRTASRTRASVTLTDQAEVMTLLSQNVSNNISSLSSVYHGMEGKVVREPDSVRDVNLSSTSVGSCLRHLRGRPVAV